MKLLAASFVLLLLPALAPADEFAEYRVPTHSWRSGSGTFSTYGWRSYGSPTLESWSRLSHVNTAVAGLLDSGFDSDRLQYGWGAQAAAGATADHGQSGHEPVAGPFRDATDSRGQATGQQVVISPWARVYPERFPLGVEISGVLQGGWSQSWSRSDAEASDVALNHRELQRRSEQLHLYDYTLTAAVAVGQGIVRDATVVEDAHVLESRLLACGAITRPLSSQARARIAGILAVAPELANAHDRPERFEWRELERVLREDGALKGTSLDAYAVLRAREGYRLSAVRRYRGHFVGLTLIQSHSHHILRHEEQFAMRTYAADTLQGALSLESSDRTVRDADQVVGGVRIEWFLPVGWRWQFGVRGQAARPLRGSERGLDATSSIQASWLVADRWEITGTLDHARYYLRYPASSAYRNRDDWSFGAGATLRYRLEDRTSLYATLEDGQSRSRYEMPSDRSYSRSTRLTAGVSYRFLGRVEAPGLFDPMSLLR